MNDERDDKLIEAARQLTTEIRPQRDLWPEIEARITAPKRSRWTPMLAQAAVVVLLIGASSGITYLAVRGDQPDVVQVDIPDEMLFTQAAFGSRYNLGPDFQDTRSHLASKLDRELDRLSPEQREDVERNLDVIRDAIGEINAALERDPDNALLQDLLLKTYREELNGRREGGGLTNDVMYRNDI